MASRAAPTTTGAAGAARPAALFTAVAAFVAGGAVHAPATASPVAAGGPGDATVRVRSETYLADGRTLLDSRVEEYVVAQDGSVVSSPRTPSPDSRAAGGAAKELQGAGSAVSADFVENGGTPSASGCRRISVEWADKSPTNRTVWVFTNAMRWCWTRSSQTVKDVTHSHDVDLRDPVIQFDGVIADEHIFYDHGTNDGHPRSALKNYRKASFSQQFAAFTLTRTIGITVRSYYDGTYRFELDLP